METSDWYRRFAAAEAAGSSPRYEAIANAVAGAPDIVAALDDLPRSRRVPTLLFAACRFVGDDLADPATALDFMRTNWPDIEAVMSVRSTQTNEAARTAAILPLLAQIDGPISLIEVGASAGLCLVPDRYRFTYGGHPTVGPPESPVHIEVSADGPLPLPSQPIEVVRRVGIDLHPLDVRDAEDLDWLRACVWPEHEARLARLDAAAELVAADPPTILKGDLVNDIGSLIDELPDGSTPVVFHSAVLAYLSRRDRAAFVEQLTSRAQLVWISNESPGVVDGLSSDLERPDGVTAQSIYLVGVNGERVAAIADPHGSWLRWA